VIRHCSLRLTLYRPALAGFSFFIIQQAEQQRLDQEALAVLCMRKHELDIADGETTSTKVGKDFHFEGAGGL